MCQFVKLQQEHMTDLTNKIDNLNSDVINKLFKKYETIIELLDTKDQKKITYLLYIINLGVNYIQTKHKDEDIYWKSWTIVLLVRLFNQEKLSFKDDIFKHIDNFLKYKKSEYKKYLNKISIYSDKYFRDSPFIDNYINNLR